MRTSIADHTFSSTTPGHESGQADTVQLHAGAEYAFSLKSVRVPLRGGCFRDESILFAAEHDDRSTWGVTVGVGLRWRRLELDGTWVRSLARDRYQRDTFRTSLRLALPAWRTP